MTVNGLLPVAQGRLHNLWCNSIVCNVLYLELILTHEMWWHWNMIYINNCPTRCNTKQSIYYSASSLYMFRVSNILIIRSTQNCNYSLWYWSYFFVQLPPSNVAKLQPLVLVIFFVQLPPSNVAKLRSPVLVIFFVQLPLSNVTKLQPPVLVIFIVQLPPSNVAKSLATLEGGSCTKNMTSTGGCSYSFVYSWWWVWLTPQTCTVNLQSNLCCISLDNY